ncbi:MAG TPA: hypothetical protein VFX35_08440 [Solirubrobacterales bacterium]|nr:hypothetical protein [Solirubrobacterales bacterium]
MAWAAPSGHAEGPLYAVPSKPPPVKESVDFTNDLNHRVRHLPAPLDPPVTETPAQVEARIRVLERGVVIKNGRAATKKSKARAGKQSRGASPVATDRDESTPDQGTSVAADDPAPLTMAFVGAGVLALIGLLLAARGRHPGRARQA